MLSRTQVIEIVNTHPPTRGQQKYHVILFVGYYSLTQTPQFVQTNGSYDISK